MILNDLNFFDVLIVILVVVAVVLQCFDAVGWAAGRASACKKLSGEVMSSFSVWSNLARCK